VAVKILTWHNQTEIGLAICEGIIKQQRLEEKERFQVEVELLAILRHPNIIGYLGSSLTDESVGLLQPTNSSG
jgi:hypothetical protein